MALTPTPWIDIHGHAGRCFLAGLDSSDVVVRGLGGPEVSSAYSSAKDAGLAAVTLSTVADLRVLAPDSAKGLRAAREFRQGEAYADHQRQLQEIERLVHAAGAEIAVTAADVGRSHVAGRTAVLVSCEGGDFLEGDLERLAKARAAGVSSLTLVHYRVNDLGDVQTEEPLHGGLTPFGRDVVAECNRLRIIVDCAHASFATTMDVLAQSSRPVMLSHSHLSHAERWHPRLLSVEHAQAVASAGGLIGAWPSGVTSTSLGDFADEVVRLAELVGPGHVGIGTDMDANYRPVLTSYAEFALLPELLDARGVSSTDTDKILGANFIDLLGEVGG